MNSLEGKVVAVTGASGIAAASARRFASADLDVVEARASALVAACRTAT